MPKPYDHDHDEEVMPFASTNFRGEEQAFGIKTDDRRRHIYVVGKTGMGKTTLLENMVLHDIHAGHGVAYIDPHGDTADNLLDFIPPDRINDVVYFNPSDLEYPIGFNILEISHENEKHLVASGMMGVFKKIWEGVWSPRMEYILLNSILALLDVPGSTMMGVARILSDKEYRKKVVEQIKDPVVRSFWVNEFAGYTDRFASEAVAPVQNKVGQFLSAGITRNIVAQTKSTFNFREIMDEKKIFIANLSKGKIGEDSSRLLGGMIITRLQLAAMERVDIPEKDRQDFYLYVDEFQNFATESFSNILSEARKYRLNLITAHQYIEQLEETVAAAIFGNVGTIISFRVGATDAAKLALEYAPTFTEEDIINLAKYEIYLKLMIDGVASTPFSAATLPPIAKRMNSREKVINTSRERYTVKREIIEEKVNKWSEYMAVKPVKDKKSYDKRSDNKKPPSDYNARKDAEMAVRKPPPPPKDGMFEGSVRVAKDDSKVELPKEASKREVKESEKPKLKDQRQAPTTNVKPVVNVKIEAPKAEPKEQQEPPKNNSKSVLKAEASKADTEVPKAAKPVQEQKPAPMMAPKPLPKLASPIRNNNNKNNNNNKHKNRRPLPPPPGDGSFSGKIRIVKEEDLGPSVVFKEDVPKEKTKPKNNPKKVPKVERKEPRIPLGEPDIQVPPYMRDEDDGPKKLDPGESVKF